MNDRIEGDGRVTARGRVREVTNGSFGAAKLAESLRTRPAGLRKSLRPLGVGSSSSQAVEPVVHRRLTRERQVSNTLLAEFTDQIGDSSGRAAGLGFTAGFRAQQPFMQSTIRRLGV